MLDPRASARRASRRADRSSLPPGGAHWYAVARVGFPDHDTFHATYAAADRMARRGPGRRGRLGREHDRDRRVLAGRGDVLRARAGRRAARAGRHRRPQRVHADGRGLRARPRRPRGGFPSRSATASTTRSSASSWVATRATDCQRRELDVTYREYPLPHMVDPGFLDELSREWVPAALERAR